MIIFDMDGTLTKVGNRLKYINTEPKDWAKFLDACGEDEPNIPIIKIFKVFQLHTDTKIKVVTGRDEKYRQISLNWLHNHELWVETKDLHMRHRGDKRHDYLIKPELIANFKDEIEMIFEDRSSVVKMWRDLGITCLQVNHGNF